MIHYCWVRGKQTVRVTRIRCYWETVKVKLMSMVTGTLMDYYSVRGWVIARTMEMETTTHWLRDWWKPKVTAKGKRLSWVTDYYSD